MTLSLLGAAALQGTGANKDLPSAAYIQWSPGQPRTEKKKSLFESRSNPRCCNYRMLRPFLMSYKTNLSASLFSYWS